MELGSRLVPFPLWGEFDAVMLYLEFGENGKSVRRFILHVRHPQFFVGSGLGKLGAEARTKYGKAQDLALTVARRLAGDDVNSTVNYFQTRLPMKQGNRMTRKQEDVYNKNHQRALKALRAVFPERFQKRVDGEEKFRQARLLFQGLKNAIQPMITFKREEIPQNELVRASDMCLIHIR